MVKECAKPDFFSLIAGNILVVHGLALLIIFDIFEHGWVFFFMILIMLISGGAMFYNETEKILDAIKKD
ncbi:MAG: hypothetical protein AAB772_01040 [Patescibacteria group bacterium]